MDRSSSYSSHLRQEDLPGAVKWRIKWYIFIPPVLRDFHATADKEIRTIAKTLILDFMNATGECQHNMEGLKLAQIFKRCGFDWGDYPKTTSSNQQYWVSAIVRELEAEGKVERVSDSGPWRLKRS